MSTILQKLNTYDRVRKPASREIRASVPPFAFEPKPAARYPKTIGILGSTGSIGLSTLDTVRTHPEKFRIKVLAAKKNYERVVAQALEFRPELVCLYEEEAAREARRSLSRYKIRVVSGLEGLKEASSLSGVDEILFAMVGAVGLIPIFAALQARKQIAIANKEPLVMAGELLVREARRLGVPLLPVDSEHSGVWQCLEGRDRASIHKIVLTSSGGPFRTRRGSLDKVTPKQALKHPCWKMGPKITIDSATLMNKGLEVIEAANLFEMNASRVEVLVHPEAVIHAMVTLVDGSVIAHMGITDMRLPIQYALSYPDRLVNHLPALDFVSCRKLHFEKPDLKRFPCLALGYAASQAGGSMPAVLNAANEIAVEAFLGFKIGFNMIPKVIEKTMKKHRALRNPSLSDLLETDAWARQKAEELL